MIIIYGVILAAGIVARLVERLLNRQSGMCWHVTMGAVLVAFCADLGRALLTASALDVGRTLGTAVIPLAICITLCRRADQASRGSVILS